MFKGTLFEEQRPAAAFLCNKRQAGLFWPQGGGKTIICLAAAEKLFELGAANKALVLCPGAFIWQWKDRADEFTDSSSILVRAKDKKTRIYNERQERYTFLPYSLFRRDFEEIISSNHWDIVIGDEAQEFKNHKSKTHDLLKRFNRENKPLYRWALTGTAISKKLEDVYSIMYWVDKTFLPPWPQFEENHIVRDEVFKQIVGYKNIKPLNLYLKNRVDRKSQIEIAKHLPKLRFQTHRVDQGKEYKDAQREMLKILDEIVGDLRFDDEGQLVGQPRNSKASRTFHALRKACSGKQKLTYIANLINQLEREDANNKFVVFSFYKEPLYELQNLLKDVGVRSHLYTGDQKDDQKRDNVQKFKSEKKTVLLCSNAGAAGLDLPFANHVINIDIPFAFGVLDQRIKRIVRVSSGFESVLAHYVILEDSMEEYYLAAVESIARLQEAVLGNSDKAEDTITVKIQSLRQYLGNLSG